MCGSFKDASSHNVKTTGTRGEPQKDSGCCIIYQHLCGMVVDRLMEAAGVAPASRLEEPRPALGISVRWRMPCCRRPRGCVM